jgi:hypothetical protein
MNSMVIFYVTLTVFEFTRVIGDHESHVKCVQLLKGAWREMNPVGKLESAETPKCSSLHRTASCEPCRVHEN